MASKNGNHDDHGLTGDQIEKALQLLAKIKDADDVRREPVEIPEWGVTVYVETMTADDRDSYEQWVARERSKADEEGREPNLKGIRSRVAVCCTVDAEGTHLFTDADRDWLGKKSSAALDRIFTAADRLSGLTPSSQDDIRGNSPTPADSADASSGSA